MLSTSANTPRAKKKLKTDNPSSDGSSSDEEDDKQYEDLNMLSDDDEDFSLMLRLKKITIFKFKMTRQRQLMRNSRTTSKIIITNLNRQNLRFLIKLPFQKSRCSSRRK